ncbi:hypothetical protein V6N11_017000 [Hibiscus sabdariffa]|uniref:Uncharacterized protein n=1 Tax=Hibiscus sabdariffa TaxID=183260 RepID=A0ABR2TWZ3_9ROSI
MEAMISFPKTGPKTLPRGEAPNPTLLSFMHVFPNPIAMSSSLGNAMAMDRVSEGHNRQNGALFVVGAHEIRDSGEIRKNGFFACQVKKKILKREETER